MKLKPLNPKGLQRVRLWRNECLEALRTPYQLTEENQSQFLKNLDVNKHRYWLIFDNKTLIGMGGITNIQWENGLGEISLILSPKMTRKGRGRKIVGMLLAEAFDNLRLRTVFGECYKCNPAVKFWGKITKEHGGTSTTLPDRKLWKGEMYDSLYFSISSLLCPRP